ncbi:hypothetical protein BGX31_008024 [Mortierella sp. GBA43]|nr:hypothetical protein BGX31_008024 [Mortierella sp. GBA43]
MPIASIQAIAVNIPELLLAIVEYLDSSDIARCMATCKTLAIHLEPSLWQHLTIRNQAPLQDSILKNRHRIHSITIRGAEGFSKSCLEALAPQEPSGSADGGTCSPAQVDQPFSKLRAITFGPPPDDLNLQRTVFRTFVDLAHLCHRTLRTLTLPAAVLMQEWSIDSVVQDTLPSRLPNLSHLTIENGIPVGWNKCSLFLVRCFQHPRLVSLHCNFRSHSITRLYSISHLLAALEKATKSKEGTGASYIKDLRLPWTGSYFLVPFLKLHGPNLETMAILSAIDQSANIMEQTVEASCPNIRHMSFESNQADTMSDVGMAAIVRGCKRVGLQSIRFSGIKHQQQTIKSLLSHHTKTLRTIDFRHSVISSEHQCLLLEGCPNLRRLWIQPKASQPPRSFSIYASYCKKDWVCLDMKELRLTYGLDHLPPQRFLGKSLARRQSIPNFYKQIGRLVQLEFLVIGSIAQNHSEKVCFEFDLTLKKGSLGELKGLTKLRRLHMSTDLWSRMSQAEVEFMDQNWPALRTVSFGCLTEQMNEIRNTPHWRWLQEKRPWLQLYCSQPMKYSWAPAKWL